MRSLQALVNTVQFAVPSVDAFVHNDTFPTAPKAEHLSQLPVNTSTSFTVSLLSSCVLMLRTQEWNQPCCWSPLQAWFWRQAIQVSINWIENTVEFPMSCGLCIEGDRWFDLPFLCAHIFNVTLLSLFSMIWLFLHFYKATCIRPVIRHF